MPIYEYECQACAHRFEEWQKMSDAPIEICPKCQARKVEKLISQTSFQLKGGGWYSDLYASSKSGSTTSAPAESKSTTPATSTSATPSSSGSEKSSTPSTTS